MTFEIFLDILIIALLSVGIVYAVILEHRLSTAKENKRELAQLIEQFYKASQKTAAEFVQLKKMEDDARQALIRDELVFLLNKIQNTPLPKIPQNTHLNSPAYGASRSQAEQDLMKALNSIK